MSSFGLPSAPPPLKSIAPYLQRADELHQKEPIVAYWCVYYATQVGISLKTKDDASRMLLLNLLDVLENFKKEIGPNDAIDFESASSAYVENFALKVFTVADDEDRRGDSTRSTAKKFLAAANFLEVLKTFPKTELTETMEDKIRYAKWKAADIAKAFREGRKPTPGPAGQQPSPQLEFPAPTASTSETNISTTSNVSHGSSFHPVSSPSSSPKSTSPARLSPPAIKRSSPPPALDEILPQRLFTPPRTLLGINPGSIDPTSPGNWSTAATPGAGTVQGSPTEESLPDNGAPESPTPGSRHKPRSGSANSTDSQHSPGPGGSGRRETSLSPKKVHFSADASSAPEPSLLPPFVPPRSMQSSQPPLPPNNYSVPTQPSPVSHSVPPPPPAPAVLTSSVITKVQKHCRFAISALDYEDAETARKELRAALAELGG